MLHTFQRLYIRTYFSKTIVIISIVNLRMNVCTYIRMYVLYYHCVYLYRFHTQDLELNFSTLPYTVSNRREGLSYPVYVRMYH